MESQIDGLDDSRVEEAENYFLQATFILHSLQANLSVYGSNSAFSGAQPADVDLALRYIDRSLEIWPNNPKYLNLKALFLIEGGGDKPGGLALMERAAKLAPDDITIQNNLEKSKQDNCFIASTVFESQSDYHVVILRRWRDCYLRKTTFGNTAITMYYKVGPNISKLVKRHNLIKAVTRIVLIAIVRWIELSSKNYNHGVSMKSSKSQFD